MISMVITSLDISQNKNFLIKVIISVV